MPRPSEKGTAKRPEENTTAGSKRTYLLSLPHLPTIVTRSTAVERACSFGQAHVCALAAAGDPGALPPHPRDFLSHGSDASMCGEKGGDCFLAQSQKPKTIGNTGCAMGGRTASWKRTNRPRGEKPSPGTQIPRRIDAPSTWLSLSGLLPSRARLLFTRRVPEYAHFARYSTDRAAPVTAPVSVPVPQHGLCNRSLGHRHNTSVSRSFPFRQG